jgi:putative spermidine/putrescine transport system permease protein
VQFSWAWLGVVPFFLFVLAFLFLPSSTLFTYSFLDANGNFTLENILNLREPYIVNAYWLSIRISALTALMGGATGFLLAYAITIGRAPKLIRDIILTFSGLAANFGGVPLAFSFIATVGRTGFITAILKALGIDIYKSGFTLYGFWGLSVTYLYFQLPLMILIMAPALEAMKREWREAAENLGATPAQYWRYIGIPILTPTLLGTMILLFGNAFGAYATAQALTGGTLTLVTTVIGSQIRGDVLGDPGLGYALVVGMVGIMSICIAAYSALQRVSERWLK